MAILFHPTHRKFIKLLRSYADREIIINITDYDRERYSELLKRTNNPLERHKIIYLLILEILNRPTSPDEGCLFTHEVVNYIEQSFVRAERRKPCVTFQMVVIMPLLQSLIRKFGKK